MIHQQYDCQDATQDWHVVRGAEEYQDDEEDHCERDVDQQVVEEYHETYPLDFGEESYSGVVQVDLAVHEDCSFGSVYAHVDYSKQSDEDQGCYVDD